MGLFGVDCHDGLLLALSRTFYREEIGIREICIAVFECLFFIFLVLRNICGWEDAVVHEVWWVLLFPCLWLGHRFYPFRAVRRNQHLNFFLFFMALYVIILYGSSMFVSAFGNM